MDKIYLLMVDESSTSRRTRPEPIGFTADEDKAEEWKNTLQLGTVKTVQEVHILDGSAVNMDIKSRGRTARLFMKRWAKL